MTTIHDIAPRWRGRAGAAGDDRGTDRLGESWDDVVAPEGMGLRLRAAAPPLEAHEAVRRIWLAIDPRQLAIVS